MSTTLPVATPPGTTGPRAGRLLLGIDTSAGLSVAVAGEIAGGTVAAERFEPRPTVHAEQLSGLIEAACRDAGTSVGALTGIVVGTGPAPFTGLRVGLMTARVLGDALGIPVSGVCSLDVLAQQVRAARQVRADGGAAAPHDFVVATDARRREVYWGRYLVDPLRGCIRVDGPGVGHPAALAAALGPGVPVFGPGAALHPDSLGAGGGPQAVSAAALLSGVLDGALATTGTEPLYLRRPDVSPPAGVTP